MPSTSSSHRKSTSGSSFFRRSSFTPSNVASSTDNQSTSVPASPSKKAGTTATRLSSLLIPSSDATDANEEAVETITPTSTRAPSHLSMTESPTRSSVPSSPVAVGPRPSLSRKGTRPNSGIFGSFKSLRFSEDYSSGAAQNENRERRMSSYMAKDMGGREDNVGEWICEAARHALSPQRICACIHSTSCSAFPPEIWQRTGRYCTMVTHRPTLVYFGRSENISSLPTLISSDARTKAEPGICSTRKHHGSYIFAPLTLSRLPAVGKRGSLSRHGSSPSIDSEREFNPLASEISGSERAAVLPLEYIVAIHQPDDSKNIYTLEISYLDKEVGQGSSLSIQLADAEARDTWLKSLRKAANAARLLDGDPIPQRLSEYAARAVEREQDYDPSRFRIYKVAKRSSNRAGSRSTTDDTSRMVSTVCFFIIGVHKIHLIAVPKSVARQSSPALADLVEVESFGILTLTWISVSEFDDNFALAWRFPLQPAQSLQLSSLAAQEIAIRLRHSDKVLRPEWLQRPFAFVVPTAIDEQYVEEEPIPAEDHSCFDRTLTAFAVAYDVNPSAIRYTINYTVEDAPRFELLEPAHPHPPNYSVLELLAILRALRCNESFNSLYFRGVQLNTLNELTDPHGLEHISITSKYGSPTGLTIEDQQGFPLLVQELRALAIGSKSLRRVDFSYCFSSRSKTCGILEALAPLCKGRLTQIDWLNLSGIELGERDVELLLDLAADKRCRLRAVELKNCGLGEDVTALLVDAFRAQVKTLEIIDISYNKLRINPSTWSKLLMDHSHLRKLDLSGLAVAPSNNPLLSFQILTVWQLEHLRLAGICLNDPSVEALCRYLKHPQSQVLYELDLCRCSISGRQAADLMISMTQESETARYLHLNISENNIQDNHPRLTEAIGNGFAPTHLSMRDIEYEKDDDFRKLLLSLSGNRSIRYLDISCVSLPAEASEDSCKALKHLFAENYTLEELDISGEHSRLDESKVGGGIRHALRGLEDNRSLQVLRIQHQNLGVQGAGILAEVLKTNTCLRELHCESNEVGLSGFTDLVNALVDNMTLQYLPSLEEGKSAAIAKTKQQIRDARTKADGTVMPFTSSDLTRFNSVRRTLHKGSGSHNNRSHSTPRMISVPQWTENDVNTALRLVSEGWESQVQRLNRFFERNWRLATGASQEEAEILAGLRERVMENEIEPGHDDVFGENPSGLAHTAQQFSAAMSRSGKKMSGIKLSGPVTELSPVFERSDFKFGSSTSPNQADHVMGLGLDMGGSTKGNAILGTMLHRQVDARAAGQSSATGGSRGDTLRTDGIIDAGIGSDGDDDGESLEIKIPVRSRERATSRAGMADR